MKPGRQVRKQPRRSRATRERPRGTGPTRRESTAELQARAGNAAVASLTESGDRPAGRPLDPALRRQLEGYFMRDLGSVRIHDDERAERAASSLETVAFNVGDEIFMSRAELDPRSPRGEHVLAHEVAHIVQRWIGELPDDGRVTGPSDSVEQAAEAAAIGFTGQRRFD